MGLEYVLFWQVVSQLFQFSIYKIVYLYKISGLMQQLIKQYFIWIDV